MTRKLAIAMPIEGNPETARCHYAVQHALRQLGNAWPLDALKGASITTGVDVSRARDRCARIFLHETDCTDLLWWDEDVLPDDLNIINRMLETGYDVVGVPYRLKKEPEVYPYRFSGPDGERQRVEVVRGCVEVEALAFGFMLTSRAALQRMWDEYQPTRWYFDVFQGNAYETVGLFDLLYTETVERKGAPWRVKLSEDYSFCSSWRSLGGQVQMYVGPGSPVGHIGSTVYRGTIEGLVSASR